MNCCFKYFSSEDVENSEGFSHAFALLTKEKVMLDAKYLPVLEAAECGNFFAQLEMQGAFASGTHGVPKHYRLARRYTDMIMEVNRGRVEPEIEGLRNSAMLEMGTGNIEVAKQELLQAAKIMANNLPPEKWDFGVFARLHQLVFPDEEGGE